jgi:hypothetical protein
MVMYYCDEFFELYDLYCRLQDDKHLDPKAIERARIAVEKHKKSCKECQRLNPNVPMASGE